MKRITVLILLLLTVKVSISQSEVVEFLQAGTVDANKMIKAYLNPFALALGDGLNNGWYYTAETHKPFGFDLSVSVSAVKIPTSARTFDIGQLALTNVELDSEFGSIAQTVAGDKTKGPQLNVLDPNNPGSILGSFRTPPGIDIGVVPVPIVQLGIGLIPHTDILIRYVPELSFNQDGDDKEDVRVGMYGFGVKHSFNDWIPVLKKLPFDAAVFASYSNIDANTGVNFELSNYTEYEDPDYVADENQRLEIQTNTIKMGLIVSKKIAFITIFGSVGNSQSHTKIDLLGRYPVGIDVIDDEVVVTDETDPIKLRFDSSQISMDAGIRLKLAFFNVFASINKAEYTSLNAGISLGIR